MTGETRCPSCGGPVAAGAAFCGACGTPIAQAAPAAPQSAACTNCGAAIEPDAAFCGACGTPAGQAAAPTPPPPPAAQPTACGTCGAALRPGARFCPRCGASAGGAPAPAAARAGASTGPLTAQTLVEQLTWSSAAAALGFVVAFITPFLAWVSVSGVSVDPFDSGAQFRIGDILDMDNVDGYLVLLAAVAGVVALGASLAGRLPSPSGMLAIAGAGGALVLLAVIEMQFIATREGLGASNIGFGLYLLLIAGALATASPWIPARRLSGP